MEKIGNMQITDNKENKFFCFPMISMACTRYFTWVKRAFHLCEYPLSLKLESLLHIGEATVYI